jgi:hypothetical protein
MGLVAAGFLLAALTVHPAQAETSAAAVGRASSLAGLCSTLGWESSLERARAAGEAVQRAHPELSGTETAAAMDAGVVAAQADVDALIEAYRRDKNAAALREALKSRCDGVARDFPAIMNRAPDTDARFERALTWLDEP